MSKHNIIVYALLKGWLSNFLKTFTYPLKIGKIFADLSKNGQIFHILSPVIYSNEPDLVLEVTWVD